VAIDLVLWASLSPREQADARLFGGRVLGEHRGCGAAIRWPDGRGYHLCRTAATRGRDFCRRHAIKAGLVPASPSASPPFPHGLDTQTGRVIRRNALRMRITVGDFRLMGAGYSWWRWDNIGPARARALARIRATWTDRELIETFGLSPGGPTRNWVDGVCNWVGEGVYV
jgi:hypothetical protein